MLLNRREWLKAALASAAGMLFPFGDRVLAYPARVLGFGRSENDAAPWWLLYPYRQGSAVGHDWSVAALSPIRCGAAVLTLERRDGAQARVHLCRRRGMPRGLAHSGHLDFVLMDGSNGSQPTDEALGRVVLSIAKRVERNERLAKAEFASLSGLMPHDERQRRFGTELPS